MPLVKSYQVKLTYDLLFCRCGAHTVELMAADMVRSISGLKDAIEKAMLLVTTIRSRKHLTKALHDAQLVGNADKKPITLVYHANTRK